MKQHKKLLMDLVFAAVILAAAAVLLLVRKANQTTVHIRIQDGAARFVDSPCPDHICESFGWLSEEDQTATCLPARAVLSIIPTT